MSRPALRDLWPPTERSKVLASFGLVCCGLGALYISDTTSPSLKHTLSVALRWVPIQAYGVMFLLGGATAVFTALTRWHKPLGFAALYFCFIVWGAAYFAAWAFGDASPTGTPFGLNGVFILVYSAVFWLLCVAIKAVSRMLDPAEVAKLIPAPPVLPFPSGHK